MWSELPSWNSRVTTIDWRRLGPVSFTRAIGRCRAGDALILNGALGFDALWRDLAAAVLTRARGRGVALVVSDATWQPRAEQGTSRAGKLFVVSDILNRFLVRRLIGPRSVFCLLSPTEVDDFVASAPAPRSCGRFTPFTYQLPEGLDPDAMISAPREPYVFSGGNTMRDWPLLIEALADTGIPVRVAARPGDHRWPANFEVGPVAEPEFFHLATRARLGVLALRHDVVRSCGQQTYLNLLRLGTPVVVNDAPGARAHLDDVPGSRVVASRPEALREAVTAWFADGAQDGLRQEAASGAAIVAERFDNEAYLQRLIDEARRLL